MCIKSESEAGKRKYRTTSVGYRTSGLHLIFLAVL